MKKTAILVTTFNRKDTTLRGLGKLKKAIEQMDRRKYLFDIFLVDDGSTDGTYESVNQLYPEIHLYKGNGKLFWVHGMQLAWEKAITTNSYDYFLWFNDDNELYEKALEIMFESSEKNQNSIICGAFCNHGRQVTFGGRNNRGIKLEPNGECQEICRANGNLVLIPQAIYKVVGMLDKKLRHNLGDYDYALRVRKAGFSVLLTPEYVGVNELNEDELMEYLKEISFFKRWKMFHSPKHHPKYPFYFHKKHIGLAVALKDYINQYLYVFFPSYLDFYRWLKEKKKK